MINKHFVEFAELAALLLQIKDKEQKLFHVCIISKETGRTQEEEKLIFIKSIIEGDYDK